MDSHFENGRLFLDRKPDEIKPLLTRLNRIEGQVRGIRAMIESGRHCRDELQQLRAVSSALREVAAIIASQHIEAGIDVSRDEASRDAALADLLDVLRAAIQ